MKSQQFTVSFLRRIAVQVINYVAAIIESFVCLIFFADNYFVFIRVIPKFDFASTTIEWSNLHANQPNTSRPQIKVPSMFTLIFGQLFFSLGQCLVHCLPRTPYVINNTLEKIWVVGLTSKVKTMNPFRIIDRSN